MLSLQKISAQYRHGALAVNKISFSLGKGDFLTVYADKEGGKTTLLKAISGLTPLKNGKILFEGRENPSVKERDVFLMHEDGGFFRLRSVRYNLSYPLKIREKTLDTTALTFVGEKLLKKPIYRLTAEEKLAVNMERALLRDASVYLIDDPFKPFSPDKRKKLFEKYFPYIQSKTENAIVVYATSSIEEAASIGKNTIVLSYGTEQQRGTWEEIKKNPTSLSMLALFDDSCHFEKVHLQDEKGLFVEFMGQKYPIIKEKLLNDVYIGSEVYAAIYDGKIILFDEKNEQRIYFT